MREVKPFINVNTKNTIYKLCSVLKCSVMEFTRWTCKNAIQNDLAYELSPHFKRTVKIGEKVYVGNKNALPFKPNQKEIKRISMIIDDDQHDYMYNISYAMESTVSKVVAYAVEKSMYDFNFLNDITTKFFDKQLDDYKKNMLFEIMKNVNNNNKYQYNLTSLLLYSFDEYRNVHEGISEIIKKVVS